MNKSVIVWNGTELPPELKRLPPGRYSVELVEDAPPLSDDEDAGIGAAIDELEAGDGIPLAKVIAEIRKTDRP